MITQVINQSYSDLEFLDRSDVVRLGVLRCVDANRTTWFYSGRSYHVVVAYRICEGG